MALVEIIAHIIPKFSSPKEAVSFLEATEPKVKINSEAVALCKVLQGQLYLDKLSDQAATKVKLKPLSPYKVWYLLNMFIINLS